ncbi:GAF domain-containing protein [Actinoplanes siamensis]|uniref:GAF domain-containing protein n=1 Tax=Actinoplanes siamensis TaxID=1223317 RepID=A0A919N631_9ACTN|nr:GAF domain-containing protein [Actinoplanes siamensis]GIF05055.1 hypothetical protein Asi03nite_25930 [Actinoplanes siamensis]
MSAVIRPPHALTDPTRIRALASIDFDNPALRAALDKIAQRTAALTGLPVSMVTLVLDTAQLIVGSCGLDDSWMTAAGGTPVEWSFCANTVTTGRPYVLPDTAHSEQAASPLVTVDGMASYAGVPITLAGHIVGAHCVMGLTAQPFTPEQLDQLRGAAAEISDLLRQFSQPTSAN